MSAHRDCCTRLLRQLECGYDAGLARITLTRNGEGEAVLISIEDLEGMEMTLEILGEGEAVARISESLAALGRGEPGADMATVRQDLARRRATGS